MGKIHSTTVSGEEQRVKTLGHNRSNFKGVQQNFGTIIDVHPVLPLVKVIFEDNKAVAGNNWVGLSHSVMDIAHRFGKLRKGLRVLISHSGEAENVVTAEIVGFEGEKLGAEYQINNNFDSEFPWEILSPGA